MKDFELENLAIEDIDTALDYIGYRARSKNIYQGNRTRKLKNDYFGFELPLFAQTSEENYLGDSKYDVIQSPIFTRVK